MGRPRKAGAGYVERSKDYRTGKVSPWWHLRVPVNGRWKRVPCKPPTQDEAEAQRQLHAWHALRPTEQHRKVETSGLTVNDLLDLFETEAQSFGTAYQPERVLAWREAIGTAAAVDVERQDLMTLLNRWRKRGVTFSGRPADRVRPISGTTCNRYVAVLRRAFALGRRDRQLLTPLVFPHFRETPRGTPITDEESQQLCAEIRKERLHGEMRAMQARFAWLSGARLGKHHGGLRHLVWPHVRFTELAGLPVAVILWPAKETKHKRRAHETASVGEEYEILRWAWEHRTDRSELVFHANGRRLPDPRYALRRACVALGLPYGRDVEGGRVFHDYRHAAVTQFVKASGQDGVPAARGKTMHLNPAAFASYFTGGWEAQVPMLLNRDRMLAAQRPSSLAAAREKRQREAS